MSDGASGGAPAVAAPPSSPAPSGTPEAKGTTNKHAQGGTAPAPKSAPPAAKSEAKTEAPAWSDEDKAKFFELAKRSPFKAKIKGEERAIDSEESLRDLLNHAQRGIAGSKVAEERNKLQAELEAAKAEREEYARTVEAAKKGDWNARKQLGLLSPDEIRQREAEWEQVPEPVRQLTEEHERLRQEYEALKAEQTKVKQAEEAKRQQAEAQQARKVALEHTHEAMTALGLNEGNAERIAPFVEMAIRDLKEAGLEIGVDMTTDLIVDRAKQMMGEFNEEMFALVQPKQKLQLVSKDLEGIKDDGQLLELLGPQALRIAKAVARSMTQKRAQAATPPPQSPMQREVERRPEPPKVLSPFRFGGR